MSKNKLPKEIFIVAAGSKEAKKVKLGTFLSAFKKDYEMPREQTEKLIQHYLTKGGAEEPDVENIEDANERKWVISCWKALVKIMLRHEKEVKAEMDKAEAEKELGRLRRQYGLEMSQVRQVVQLRQSQASVP